MKPPIPYTAPRIIFLDIGETILGWSEQAQEDAAERISQALERPFTRRDLDRATRFTWQNRDGKSLQNVQDEQQEWEYWLAYFTDLLKNVGMECPHRLLVESLASFPVNPDTFALFPDTCPFLEYAHRSPLRLGVISNAFISVQAILKAFGLEKEFSPLILSYLAGAAKPEAEIYRMALQQAGVSAEDAWFVDDRPVFVEAACKENLRGILLDREDIYSASNLQRIHQFGDLHYLIPGKSASSIYANAWGNHHGKYWLI